MRLIPPHFGGMQPNWPGTNFVTAKSVPGYTPQKILPSACADGKKVDYRKTTKKQSPNNI
jgi:hypothetical protein